MATNVHGALVSTNGNGSPPAPWARLDPEHAGDGYDCLQQAEVAAEALKMLGIDAADDKAWPTGSCTDGLDARDTSSQESNSINGVVCLLGYKTGIGTNQYINQYEGHFWYKVPQTGGGSITNRAMVWPVWGPVSGDWQGLQILYQAVPGPPYQQIWFYFDEYNQRQETSFPSVPLPPLGTNTCQ
jgi:hypothetical protein